MYAIAFDMGIAALKKYYGEPYNNAYFEISKELRKHEFYNTQGSVYLSANGNMVNLVDAMNALRCIEWFRKSVRDIRAFKVEDWSNFAEFMKKGL
jgi:virulence-associated protein VapD